MLSSAKVMPWVCVAGVFIPLALLIGGGLGLLHWFWRKQVLAQVDALPPNSLELLSPAESGGGQSIAAKIQVIRQAKLTFLAPGIVLLAYAVIIGGLITLAINS